MAWDRKTLEECTEYITDGDHQPAPKSDDGVLFIKIKDIKDSRVDFKEALHVPLVYYEGIQRNRKPVLGDTLYTVVGSYGLSAYVNFDIPFCFERNIALLHPKKGVDSRFLFYSVNTPDFFKQAENAANGAAQKLIPLSRLKQLKIQVPPFATQQKIAGILSAYDDLIENNQKQIKLLEEAAQRLYKQWFIDLRYPGHETTKIVDGFPEGWKTVQIQDVCKNIGAGGTPSRSQKSFWENGNIDWFKTQELCDCWLFEASEKISEEGLKRSAAKMFPANSILMAIYASPTLGRLGILTKEACSNQAALCLQVDESKVSNYWLYLKLFELRDQFNSIARGAGQQNISGIIVKETEIALPAISVINDFTRLVRPFFEKQRTLQLQNISLTQTCDRLLPKLMNGELV